MAMTKKEKAAHDAEIDRLTLRLALCWTAPVDPDVPVPKNSYGDTGLSKGWLPCFDRVEPACSSSASHGFGSSMRPNSQMPRELYSTRLLALRALRSEAEERFARELKKIDNWIALEIEKPTPLPDK